MLRRNGTAFLILLAGLFLVGPAPGAPLVLPGPADMPAPSGPLRDAMDAVAGNRLEEAEQRFTTLRDANPRQVTPWLGLAEVAARRNDAGEAERRLRAGLAATDDAPELNRALGRLAAQTGDAEAMVAAFAAAQRKRPGEAVSYLELAELLQERFGQAQRSLAFYEAARSRAPQDWRAAYGHGLALARTGQGAQAVAALAEAARLDAATPLPDFSRAQVLVRLDKPAEALGAYDAALLRNPDMAEARRAKGALLLGLRRPREAAQEFQRVLAREPGEVNALLGLGMARQAGGDVPGAVEAFRAVLAQAPNHPIALNNLAWLAAEARRDLDEALRWAESAVAALPGDASALTTLGWVRRQREELSPAEEALSRAVALQSNADRLARLGVVRAGLGRREQAMADLRRALAADPANAMARQEMQRLERRR